MTDTPAADGEDLVVRPFADWLREQSNGSTHDELGESLWRLVDRVRETGKRGSLQLMIVVEPMEKGRPHVLVVSDSIKLRLPEHDRSATIFYPDKRGNLTRTDPGQLAFDSLTVVPGVGEVNPETGEVRETS